MNLSTATQIQICTLLFLNPLSLVECALQGYLKYLKAQAGVKQTDDSFLITQYTISQLQI